MNQVFKYDCEADYIEGRVGEAASSNVETWEEAAQIRDELREKDPEHYYNIVHYASVKAYEYPA